MQRKRSTIFIILFAILISGCTPAPSSSIPDGTESDNSFSYSESNESEVSSKSTTPVHSESTSTITPLDSSSEEPDTSLPVSSAPLSSLPVSSESSSTEPGSSLPVSSELSSAEQVSSESSSAEQGSYESSSSQSVSAIPSSEEGSTSGEELPPEPEKIAPPRVSLEQSFTEDGVKKGLVSWIGHGQSEHYEYSLNGTLINKVFTPSLTLEYKDTVLIRSISRYGHEFDSDWSLPFTYFGNPSFDSVIYQVPLEGKAYVYFHDSDLAPVQVTKGHSIVRPASPTREYYLFDNWYSDPLYTMPFDFNLPIVESLTIYAKWVRSSVIDNTTFWLKANAKISAAIQTPALDENAWVFIPLHIDETWLDPTVRVFKATVSVHGATSLSPGKLLVMDGWDDLPGRTYWKDENDDFLLNSDGLYNVYFSIQTHWKKDNGKYVNIYSERIGDNLTYPPVEVEVKDVLEAPILNVDHFKKEVYFAGVLGASRYEYQINNGEVKETTSLVISASPFDFVIVRALSNNSEVAASNWSRPILVHALEFSVETPALNFVNVYFYTGETAAVTIAKGDKILKPVEPIKEGYVFVDWYTDLTYTTLFDFNAAISENTVIYPKWDHEDDLVTKEYYEVVDALSNVHAKFKLQMSNLKFLEFETTLVMPNGNFTFFVRGRFDQHSEVKTYGSYNIASKLTTKLYFSPYHIWDINTERASHLFVPKIDIYFTQPTAWTAAKYYIYNKLPNGEIIKRSEWPGSDMTFVKKNGYGQNIYMVSANVRLYNSLIFNNGGSGANQTSTILLDDIPLNQQFYTTGDKDADGRLALTRINYNG